MSFVGNCDKRLLMFIRAPINSSWARSLGAPQWHSACLTASSMWWHVQPLSNARPDDRSPASICTLPELVLRVNTAYTYTVTHHSSNWTGTHQNSRRPEWHSGSILTNIQTSHSYQFHLSCLSSVLFVHSEVEFQFPSDILHHLNSLAIWGNAYKNLKDWPVASPQWGC